MADLATLSKSALARRVESLQRAKASASRAAEQVGEQVLSVAGGGVAWGAAAAVGVAETRWRNKDGSPLSLGPVSLGLAAGTLLLGTSTVYDPGGMISAAAYGALASDGVTRGRGWGVAWRAKSSAPKVGGIGAYGVDALSDEELAMLAG